MKRLRFVVKAKIKTNFTSTEILFLRETQTAKPHQVPYTDGNGFIVADGSVLYTQGIDGQIGYMDIAIDGDQTITGTGDLNLLIKRYPSDMQASEVRTVTVDGSDFDITFLYNSRPINNDVDIEVDNRTPRVVLLSDFNGYWSDYDNDSLAYITVYNADANLLFNDIAYVNGTPISVADITAGKLKYVPDDVDNQYNDDYQWTVTDSNGNESIN
jgi:hypothetical protein